MTGRAYIGEVLLQIWLKSMKKRVSYVLDKQVNVPASPRKKCAMKMKERKKRKKKKMTVA